MSHLRVANALGARMQAPLASALPDVEIVDVTGEGALPEVDGCDVLLTAPWGGPHLDRALEAGVKWIHAFGTGVDPFPFDRLPDGVVLTCSRGASAVPIAEFVLAVMLAFEKRLPDVWITEPPPHWAIAEAGVLEGRTLGVVGLGGIGSAVARRASAFDMNVIAVRRHSDQPGPDGVSIAGSLADLLPVADHLVLAVPATPATRHLLDGDAFAMVKPGVHVVNIARGALIDQDALLAALDDGRVAAATLDVADPEPLPAGHPLYIHPRVRLSPHVSWADPKALDRLVDCFADNVRRFAAGQPLTGVVDRDERY